MLDPAVRSHIDAHHAEYLAELKEFLRFESVSAQSSHHDDCLACAQWLADRLRAMGLTAEVDQTASKPAVLAHGEQRPDRATLLVYGHYDVQPPDPLDGWDTLPFDPTELDDDLVARGASDDKGPLLCWIKAAQAHQDVTGEMPVNLKVFVEGEEEIGSPTLGRFIQANADKLRCDHVVVSDTAFHADGVPSITYGLRGLTYVEVTLTGPNRDLHSGIYGGAVTNPLNALAGLVAGLHDDAGRVTLKGFYDDVVPLAPGERAAWDALGGDDKDMMKDLGVDGLAGEAGYTTLQRTWARPALDCNGIWGGYMDEGAKTVIPSWAKTKLSVRLVCNQRPESVCDALREYLQANRPAGTTVNMEVLSAEEPWLMSPDAPQLATARSAMEEAFEHECTLIRCGASVPATVRFQKHLGVDPLMMGFSLPDDRVHSPNEKFRIDHFWRGIIAAAALMGNLGRTS